MLKKRELTEVPRLFELLSHPDVYPFVRQKADSVDRLYFITNETLEAEERGELISRTITDEYLQPIGVISLFDIKDNHGFLATWIGQPYFGLGYNRLAKEEFFNDLFHFHQIETIFMKIQKTNQRSAKAVAKLPYVMNANLIYPEIYQNINEKEEKYDLYAITLHHYQSYQRSRSSLDHTEDAI